MSTLPLCSPVDIRGIFLYTNGMGTIIFILILAGLMFAVLALFVAFGRFAARNEQRAYVAGILHNIEVRGALDAEFRD